jgi:uncharacterized membrane protein
VSGLDMGLNLATIDAAEETQVVAGLIRIGLSIVGGIVGLFLQLGVIRIFANLAFGRDAEVGMLFTEGHRFLSGLGASILVGIITVIGMILLIVPGVIASLGLYFTLYLVIDQEMGAIDALSESWRLTDGEKGFLFVFNLLMVFGALILMVVTCGIGYLIVVPTLALVQAVMYHSLVSMKGTAANPTSGFAS